MGSSQTLDSGQWRISFQGLSRSTRAFLNQPASHLRVLANEAEEHFQWIFTESTQPLELVFDLHRISPAELFEFEIEADEDASLVWSLEALNSDETLSAGSIEIAAGDSGALLSFDFDEEEWFVTAKAPQGRKRSAQPRTGKIEAEPRVTRVLIDASPSARGKLECQAAVSILQRLDQLHRAKPGKELRVSYLGLFDLSFSTEQQIESQHRELLQQISTSDLRPEPLRKVVLREVDAAMRGTRLLVLSDGAFLISRDLDALVQEREIDVDILVFGHPAVVPDLNASDRFELRLVPDRLDEDELEEICIGTA